MRISLRKLSVFDAVARHGSVSLGADEVALSQPAASMALKELEDDLGIELFFRSGRKLWLNANGRRLQPLAQSILMQAREIEQLSAPEELSGILRIAATDGINCAALGALCSAFTTENRGVRVRLEISKWADVLNAVESMSCDLGFVHAPCNRPRLSFEPLMQDDLVIFAAPGHPLTGGAEVTIQDLTRECWYLRDLGHAARESLTSVLGAMVSSLSIVLETNRDEVIRSAVMSGTGLGCLPRSAISSELSEGSLVALEVPGFDSERLIGIITPAKVYRGALQQAFCIFARRISTLAQ